MSPVVTCKHCAEACQWAKVHKHDGEERMMLLGTEPHPEGRAVYFKDRWWIRHLNQLERQDVFEVRHGRPPLARYLVHGRYTCGSVDA